MLPTKQFERDLADLTPDQFEQLVAALVRKEHANAQKLKAPDFGADVLDDPASRRPRVWQVKHYPDRISWTLCKESLDRAVAKWRPREVIFVFPRDLTGKDHQEFNDELVGKHLVPVERWTASRLNEALEEPPAIRRSFFPHRTDTLHEIRRAAQRPRRPLKGPRSSSTDWTWQSSRRNWTPTSTTSCGRGQPALPRQRGSSRRS